MVFHLLSSRAAGAGPRPCASPRPAVAVAATLLLASSPAQAFFEGFPVVGTAVLLFFLAWPPVQLMGLGLILWLNSRRPARRPARRRLRRGLIAASLLGSAGWLAVVGPEIIRSVESTLDRHYWRRVDEVARPARLAELDRRLAERGPKGAQAYLVRLLKQEPGLPDDAVLAHLFRQCADLMSRGEASHDLLQDAVWQGHVGLIRQALAVPPCAGAENPDRERYLAGRIIPLVSQVAGDYSRRMPFHDVSEEEPLHQARADAVLLLLARFPRLMAVERPEAECPGGALPGLRCNALTEAFAYGHRGLTLALLPLDNHAGAHLPEVALQLLGGRTDAAVQAARRQPAALLPVLPALFATAPAEALAGLLRAAPPDAAALLKTEPLQVQGSDPLNLFHAAAYRELQAGDWPLLWLLLDQVGIHLGMRQAQQLQVYVSNQDLEDPLPRQLLGRLRQARLPCDVLRMVVRHHRPAHEGVSFERLTGCEFKAVPEDAPYASPYG